MSGWTIFSDFDGTISIPDAVEFLLEKHAIGDWKALDELVWKGEISEREVMAREVSMLRVSWERARDEVLSGVRIREGFADFSHWCAVREIPLVIVSSGLKCLIAELLDTVAVKHVEILANDAVISEDKWSFVPFTGPRHGDKCSHCKCDHLIRAKAAGLKVVYIGDGYTDVCPSVHAELLFATGSLAASCTASNRPFIPFESFRDIERTLSALNL